MLNKHGIQRGRSEAAERTSLVSLFCTRNRVAAGRPSAMKFTSEVPGARPSAAARAFALLVVKMKQTPPRHESTQIFDAKLPRPPPRGAWFSGSRWEGRVTSGKDALPAAVSKPWSRVQALHNERLERETQL